MPVPTDTVGLAISIAAGIVKLGGKLERIATEQKALRSELGLGDHPLILPPPVKQLVRGLGELVDGPGAADLTVQDRQRLRELIAAPPSEAAVHAAVARFMPAALVFRVVADDAAFLAKVSARGWDLGDVEVRAALFYLDAGEDLRAQGLAWQLGTAVASVASELVLANQSLAIRDPRGRALIAAVLTHFASPDLETIGSWRGLLVHALSATLDAALEQRSLLADGSLWVEKLLAALGRARARGGDEFVAGLLAGRGYRILIASLLEEGSRHLSRDGADTYERIASAVLATAAEKSLASAAFRDFFAENWDALLLSALGAVKQEVPVLLAGRDPLVQTALVAALDALAQGPPPELLKGETLTRTLETALAAVAVDPSLAQKPVWLAQLLGAADDALEGGGLSGVASRAGVERLVQSALVRLAQHPELLVRRPGLPREIVGSVLASVAAVKVAQVDALLAAAVGGALEAVSEHPDLLELPDEGYARAVAALAAWTAQQVKDGALDRSRAERVLAVALGALAQAPALLCAAHPELVSQLGARVLSALSPSVARELGVPVDALLAAVLQVVARRGRALLQGRPPAALADELAGVLALALALAADALCQRLDRACVAPTIALFLDLWARGGLPSLDASPAVRDAFAALAEQVGAASHGSPA